MIRTSLNHQPSLTIQLKLNRVIEKSDNFPKTAFNYNLDNTTTKKTLNNTDHFHPKDNKLSELISTIAGKGEKEYFFQYPKIKNSLHVIFQLRKISHVPWARLWHFHGKKFD